MVSKPLLFFHRGKEKIIHTAFFFFLIQGVEENSLFYVVLMLILAFTQVNSKMFISSRTRDQKKVKDKKEKVVALQELTM